MSFKGIALSMGLGAAIGAVAIMMTPRQCTARALANKAADKIEDPASKVSDKLNQQMI